MKVEKEEEEGLNEARRKGYESR